MSGIAGIAHPGKQTDVRRMLDRMAHRGSMIETVETDTVSLGIACPKHQVSALRRLQEMHIASDEAGDGRFALAQGDPLLLKRDPLGAAPLYYGWTAEGTLCFASEVKGLLEVTRQPHELPPGHIYDGERMEETHRLSKRPALEQPPEAMAQELRRRLEEVVEKKSAGGDVGSWLSGGLDSSALAVLASRYVQPLHTFTAGLAGAPDVVFAEMVAEHIGSRHHVRTVKVEEMLAILPQVIYHLESFDAWLVRSSVVNYLAAQLASEYTPAVFSGEGGDELFAGYEYLKSLPLASLPDELIDITARLHNTALQRVDRCAAAHGITAHVAFLDPQVAAYALQIPVEYKLHAGVEKWILRQALEGTLPEAVLKRPKAKFWQGAGVEEQLSEYAEEKISAADFARERHLNNGWLVNTKEELLYYRIFAGHFGESVDLSWMGRTKGSPVE